MAKYAHSTVEVVNETGAPTLYEGRGMHYIVDDVDGWLYVGGPKMREDKDGVMLNLVGVHAPGRWNSAKVTY